LRRAYITVEVFPRNKFILRGETFLIKVWSSRVEGKFAERKD